MANAETLLPLIQEWIVPGNHNMHDGQHAYNDIPLLPEHYTHITRIHAENFVDPHQGVQQPGKLKAFFCLSMRIF